MNTALILSGGLGTRLKGLGIPKAMLPVRDKILSEHIIEKLQEAGIKKVYMAVGHHHEQIMKYFREYEPEVSMNYFIEKKPLGTGGWMHAANRTRDFGKDFIVVNGDNLFDLDWEKFKEVHSKNEALATIGITEVDNTSTRGVVKMEFDRIVDFNEKPDTTIPGHINSGYYIFSPKIFDFLPEKDKIMLETDIFPILAEKNKLYGYQDNSQWFDSDTLERWEKIVKNWRKSD